MSRKERRDGMFQTFAYYLSVLYKDFYAYAGARLHPLGVKNGLVFFVIYVGKHPGCTPAELTKTLRVDWGYSQRCITKLVEDGLITKEKAGRSYQLNLTKRGEEAFQVSHQLFYDWDGQELCSLTEEERYTLLALLNKIVRKEVETPHV